MKAFSHAISSGFPSKRSARYTPGLHGRPSTILSGARELGLSTSLALLAGELILATETETHFPLET